MIHALSLGNFFRCERGGKNTFPGKKENKLSWCLTNPPRKNVKRTRNWKERGIQLPSGKEDFVLTRHQGRKEKTDRLFEEELLPGLAVQGGGKKEFFVFSDMEKSASTQGGGGEKKKGSFTSAERKQCQKEKRQSVHSSINAAYNQRENSGKKYLCIRCEKIRLWKKRSHAKKKRPPKRLFAARYK